MVDVLAGKRAYHRRLELCAADLRTIATESAGDPRVGMIGGSYGGQIQYAVARQDPRIDAIIPMITWNDLTYSLAPGNGSRRSSGSTSSSAPASSPAPRTPAPTPRPWRAAPTSPTRRASARRT